jgi:hypothetical protein
MQIELTSDQVSALMSRLPEQARNPRSGFLFDEGTLHVPEEFEAAATEVMGQPGWDDGVVIPAKHQFTFLEFMELFTEDEQLTLVEASMTLPPVKLWYDKALGAQYIDLDDPRTEPGLQALVDANLISAARKATVMLGQGAS